MSFIKARANQRLELAVPSARMSIGICVLRVRQFSLIRCAANNDPTEKRELYLGLTHLLDAIAALEDQYYQIECDLRRKADK